MMVEYPHIDSIYKRDEHGRFTDEYSTEEFYALRELRWVGTEKVDGTNIRVMWDEDNKTLRFGGRTDAAQIPDPLVARLIHLFSTEGFVDFGDSICLYGEGFGAKIQKGGGNYFADRVEFVLFDALVVGRWWLKRDALEEIAARFGIPIVPQVFTGTLDAACEFVKAGFKSAWGVAEAEGLVLQPQVQLFNRKGERIITKVKHRDFK